MQKIIKKVLLVYPPVKNKFGEYAAVGSSSPPMGIVYLGTLLKQKGYAVKLLDCDNARTGMEEALKCVREFNPDCVGVSAVTLTIGSALELFAGIKEYNRDILTVLGGFHITVLPEETLGTSPNIDIGVLGEGEYTLIELLEALNSGRGLEEVAGIIFKKDGALVRTKERELIDDLDNLSLPDYSLLPNFPADYYPAAHRLFMGRPAGFLLASRGCPFNCSFCGRGLWGTKVRSYSVAYVLKMMEDMLGRFAIKSLLIGDELFFADPRKNADFCREMIKRRLNKKIKWVCSSRVDTLNPGVLKLMKEAGCEQISFGIESGSQKILDILNKRTTPKIIRDTLKMVKRAGVGSSGTLMLGSPGETVDTLKETIDFVTGLDIDYIVAWFFTPLPGSRIYNEYKRYGFLTGSYAQQNCMDVTFLPFGLTKGQLMDSQQELYRRFYLRPARVLREIGRAQRLSLFRLKTLCAGARKLLGSHH